MFVYAFEQDVQPTVEKYISFYDVKLHEIMLKSDLIVGYIPKFLDPLVGLDLFMDIRPCCGTGPHCESYIYTQ